MILLPAQLLADLDAAACNMQCDPRLALDLFSSANDHGLWRRKAKQLLSPPVRHLLQDASEAAA